MDKESNKREAYNKITEEQIGQYKRQFVSIPLTIQNTTEDGFIGVGPNGGAVNVENYEGEPLEEGSVNIVKGSVTPSGCISYIDSFPFDPKTYDMGQYTEMITLLYDPLAKKAIFGAQQIRGIILNQ